MTIVLYVTSQEAVVVGNRCFLMASRYLRLHASFPNLKLRILTRRNSGRQPIPVYDVGYQLSDSRGQFELYGAATQKQLT